MQATPATVPRQNGDGNIEDRERRIERTIRQRIQPAHAQSLSSKVKWTKWTEQL